MSQGCDRPCEKCATRTTEQPVANSVTFTIPVAALEWLRQGERGLSSEAIFERMTGLPVTNWRHNRSYPVDVYDWRRCHLLLERVDEFQDRFHEMADVSPQWAELVKSWPSIRAAFMDPRPGALIEAYTLIQHAIRRGDVSHRYDGGVR